MIHPLPDSFERLSDGDQLILGPHRWEVVIGRGHSPEHACLYCEELDVLISGDQVLPRISSNTSVFPHEPNANPIGEWLDSLGVIRGRVPDTALVLPSHNEPFLGLHERLSQLQAITARNIDKLREALVSPMRAVDLVKSLFRPSVASDSTQMRLATGETVAGLNFLLALGEITVIIAGDGTARYQKVT